ncbi:hypothetical protein D1F64_09770 [Breoghania sp. L-A4]|nr:hypothetical protein D1F64_09770 [Breoghania sp. L-A4]
MTPAPGFEALRRTVRRPDLDDAALALCLEAALHDLCGADASEGIKRDILRGSARADLSSRVLASLCLPPPASPLAMPVHTLERPRGRMLARLSAGVRRLRGGRRVPVRVE